MKPLISVCVVILFTAGFACAQGTSPAGGQDTAALEQKVRDLEDRLIALEGQVRVLKAQAGHCLLYTSPSPRDRQKSRMPSSA